MSKNKKYLLLAAIVIFLAAGFFSYRYVFQASETSVKAEKTDIIIEASELLEKFESDEQKANSLYLDKVIQVSGTIGEVHRDNLFVSVTLKEPADISGVICTFDSLSVAGVVFNMGDQLTAKGICTGFLMDVVLTKCAAVE